MKRMEAWEAVVGGCRVRVVVELRDGKPTQISASVPDAPLGAAWPVLMEAITRAINVGLAHGADLSAFIKPLKGRRFDPQGAVEGDPHVHSAVSVVDYVARTLEKRLPGWARGGSSG